MCDVLSDCPTRAPSQRSKAKVQNYEGQCVDPGTPPNGGENIMSRDSASRTTQQTTDVHPLQGGHCPEPRVDDVFVRPLSGKRCGRLFDEQRGDVPVAVSLEDMWTETRPPFLLVHLAHFSLMHQVFTKDAQSRSTMIHSPFHKSNVSCLLG